MNIENRLKRLEKGENLQESCCDRPYVKIELNRDNTKCWNCGNTLISTPNCETVVIYPKV